MKIANIPHHHEIGKVFDLPITINIEHQEGKIIKLCLDDNFQGAQLNGHTSARVIDGVATFDDLRIDYENYNHYDAEYIPDWYCLTEDSND